MPKKKSEKFEDLLRRLEQISDLLESDEVGLEESLKLYEEGIILSKKCLEVLHNAELKITKLKGELEKEISN